MKKICALALILPLLLALSPLQARAELRVDITSANIQPMPIAITQFYAADARSQTLAEGLNTIITTNLKSSGLFKPIDPAAFTQTPAVLAQAGPNFGEWRATNAQGLVTGKVTQGANGQANVEFRLWDVYSQQQMIGMSYTTTQENWRRIGHIISDEIYKRLTGEAGYFDSRIVYIAESGLYQKRLKRLAIMDQDGANVKYLTDGSYLVLTPRFSPTRQQITYMSYEGGRPRVYIYDLASGRRQLLGDGAGMTFAPHFSPDGNSVVMSVAANGNSDVYTMRLGGSRQRLTDNPGIDTAPTYSPDGRQIAFESDRGGTQQIYTMNADGSGVKRITFGQGRYGNPVWSPRGDLIAFTRQYQGNFYIGVIRPDGKGERLITTAYHVEGPSWSPNGRVLTYFKERPVGGGNRQSTLYTVDITGYNERPLATPSSASDPAWSPLNK